VRAPAEAKFALDEAHCGDDIEILSDRVSATIHINNKWRSVRGALPIASGRRCWDVRLERCQSSNMFIGVCADGFDVNNYCGKDGFSYGLYGCSNVYHMAASRKYGETVHTGDVVRVLLDQDRRTLHYELNGTPLGLGTFVSGVARGPRETYPTARLTHAALGSWLDPRTARCTAFDNLPAVVYPCFSLYTVDDEFTVENYSTF
jgi:hypothetical protein